jgi:CheY-like chemotaxis protein
VDRGTADGDQAPIVLVVEDDVAVRFLMGVVLGEDLGVRVVEAASGPDAVVAAARARPSLIILDLMLPGFDGIEVLRRLRADSATRDIPVVAMSAAAGGTQALAEGCAAFLQKPFDLDDVVAAARRALIPHVAGGSPDPLRVVREVATERRTALRARVAACRSAHADARVRLAGHRAGTRAVLAAVRRL